LSYFFPTLYIRKLREAANVLILSGFTWARNFIINAWEYYWEEGKFVSYRLNIKWYLFYDLNMVSWFKGYMMKTTKKSVNVLRYKYSDYFFFNLIFNNKWMKYCFVILTSMYNNYFYLYFLSNLHTNFQYIQSMFCTFSELV
jgi:hypothetical protein